MLNVTDEVNNLKLTLSMDGVPFYIIDGIEKEVRREIATRTYDALDDAIQKAQEAGEDYRAEDFINELTAVKIGDSFRIGTDSGKTDFSTPPFPMLPKLLKNAKIAKDGSRYKVIPMVKKGTIGLTTESAMGDLNRARADMKSMRGHKKLDPTDRGESFIGLYNKQRSSGRTTAEKKHTGKGAVDFRTASSKQDANTQWVHPGRNADMTDTLESINNSLFDEVQFIIKDVISRYKEAI